jgi:hypothetical protein
MINKQILNWSKYLDMKFNTVDEDGEWYINVPRCQNTEEEKFVQNELIKRGAIPLNQLEIGKTYIGSCRNASEAVWQGEKFIYQRHKFGFTFPEEINHFQNDNGFDVFVPIKIKEDVKNEE